MPVARDKAPIESQAPSPVSSPRCLALTASPRFRCPFYGKLAKTSTISFVALLLRVAYRAAVPKGPAQMRGSRVAAGPWHHRVGSDSGLVTCAAFKAVRLRADPRSGGFDSHPLPPSLR